MKKNFLSFLCYLLLFSVNAEEDTIEEIISVASKVPMESKYVLATVDVIDSSILEKQVQKDLLSIFSNTLALDTSSNGGPGQVSSIFLRGSNSNQTLVKVNGVKINPSTAGGASIYNFDSSLISKLEVVYGPFSSIHGSEAIGGVIDISTIEDPKNNYLVFGLNSGPDNFRKEILKSSWNNKKTFLSLGLLNSNTEGFPVTTGSNLNRGYKNQSAIGAFSHQKGHFKGTFSSWSSEGVTEYLGFDDIPMSQDYKNQAYAFDLSYKPKAAFWVLSNLNTSGDFIAQNQENYLGLLDLTETDRTNFEITLHKPIQGGNSFTFGYNLENEKVNYSSFGTEFKQSLKTKSIFASSQLVVNQHLIGINIRSSNHELHGNKLSWNLGYLKHLNKIWTVVLNSGEAFRSPNSSELYGYGANLELKPETSNSHELSAIRKINQNDLFSLVFFINKTQNLINFDFSDYILKNIKQSNTKGAELKYKWKNKAINGNMLIRIQDPKNQEGKQLQRRSRRSISINLIKEYISSSINLNILAFDRRVDFGEKVLSGYSLINFSVTKEISNQIDLAIRFENLLDKEYFTAAAASGYYRNQERSIWLNVKYTLGR